MTEPIKVPLTAYQIARLALLGTEAAQAQAALDKASACVNEVISAAVAAHHDIEKIVAGKWSVARVGDEIVCTPPAPAEAQ